MKGFYFEEDTYLQGLDLNKKIEKFILSFEEIFGERIIDEVFIVNYDGLVVIPIYFYCAHLSCDKSRDIDVKKAEKLRIRKLKDFDFFIENILKRQCILNNEGIIAKNQMGGLFDAMFRMDNYYIGLSNTTYSFKELEEKIGITEEVFIKIVKKFYSELRGK